MAETMAWYAKNEWWRPIKSGEFKAYYAKQYGERLALGALEAEKL